MGLIKGLLIFTLGAAAGAGGSYVFFERKAKKIRKEYDIALAQTDEYYQKKCQDCGAIAESEKKPEEEIPENVSKPVEPRGGSFKTPYSEIFNHMKKIDPAYAEHPEDDESVEIVRQAPIKIKPRYYGSDDYSMKVLYYYTIDDALIPEGASYQDILDTDEVKDAIGDVLDKYHFKDERNNEDEIFVRNYTNKCDYRIIKRIGSLSEDYDGEEDE